MSNILGVFIIAFLAFMAGGYYVKDEAIRYVDNKCNTEYIIETYREHFYECKPIAKPISKQMNKEKTEWILQQSKQETTITITRAFL